ncbi:flagellar hook capping FlgD N-terminal domain-containing protein [Novosphingobium sp.]|jgi:flagellar basal-body rod modification protein FlgD|uniref:flagellar hook assembly protein FlgD n=1 Tax=Novosphingobium sp. TaxID=1874826 RepID=UPI0031D5C282
MTAVSSTGSTGSTTGTSTSTSTKSNTQLGMNDFISLLTTELQNQDPTAPQDNTQMIAQMAQFSTLSATTGMSDTLSGISDKLDKILAAQQAAATGTATGTTTPTDTSTSDTASTGATA